MFFIIFSLMSFVFCFVHGEKDDIPLLMKTNCQLIKASFLYKSLKLDKKCIYYSGMQENRTLICLMVNICSFLANYLFVLHLPPSCQAPWQQTINARACKQGQDLHVK